MTRLSLIGVPGRLYARQRTKRYQYAATGGLQWGGSAASVLVTVSQETESAAGWVLAPLTPPKQKQKVTYTEPRTYAHTASGGAVFGGAAACAFIAGEPELPPAVRNIFSYAAQGGLPRFSGAASTVDPLAEVRKLDELELMLDD